MREQSLSAQREPRWGSADRDRKAEAIWRTLLHYAGPAIRHGRWLDIGCGSGGIAAHLAPRVSEMSGMDPEPWAKWAEWMRAQPNLVFMQGGYDHEPPLLPPCSVDVVVCNQVYEHVADPVALLGFIHRILKPGGYCYFAGPNLLFPIEPHVFWPFVHWLPRKGALRLMRLLGARRGGELDAYSTHFWQLKAWLSANFELTNAVPFFIREVVPAQHGAGLWRALGWLPVRLIAALTPFSPGFVFVLQKHA